MIRRFGIDTSIMVRLLTGDPSDLFARCVARLLALHEIGELFASNQVIGEAYIAVQHHYGVRKGDAREALFRVLSSGLVHPLDGQPVLEQLTQSEGCGLFDRLIALEYRRRGLTTLTLDLRMSRLDDVRSLLANEA